VQFDLSSVQAGGFGVLHLGRIWEAHLKLGIAHYRTRGHEQFTGWEFAGWELGRLIEPVPQETRELRTSDTGLHFAVGIGANIGSHWHVRFAIGSLLVDERVVGENKDFRIGDYSIDSSTLSVHYLFGGHPRR
jgi:hypothetical protein